MAIAIKGCDMDSIEHHTTIRLQHRVCLAAEELLDFKNCGAFQLPLLGGRWVVAGSLESIKKLINNKENENHD